MIILDANIRESTKVKSPAYSFGGKPKSSSSTIAPSPNAYNTSGLTAKGSLLNWYWYEKERKKMCKTRHVVTFPKTYVYFIFTLSQEKMREHPQAFISRWRILRSLWPPPQEHTTLRMQTRRFGLLLRFILLESNQMSRKLGILQVGIT